MEKWTEQVQELLNDQYDFVLSGTGSRTFDRFGDQELRRKMNECVTGTLIGRKAGLIVSGGAQGFDHYLARVAYGLHIHYVLLIPSPEYPSYYWTQRGSVDRKDHTDIWNKMVECSQGVYYVNDNPRGRRTGRYGHANFDRNEAMMGFADHVLVYDPSTPGTAHAFALIRNLHKSYTLVNEL